MNTSISTTKVKMSFASGITLLLYALFMVPIHGEEVKHDQFTPERIIINLTEQPSNNIAITWRTVSCATSPVAEIMPSVSANDTVSKAIMFEATIEPITTNHAITSYSYSVLLNQLESGNTYRFRVGSTEGWSEWNTFQTSPNDTSDFTFVYFGDAQHGLENVVQEIFSEAKEHVPDARFWLFTGDLVDKAEDDSQWNDLFKNTNSRYVNTPLMTATGNHEYYDTMINGKEVRWLDPSFRQHFTLPENGIGLLKESSYYINYQNAKIIVLNGNEYLSEQAIWLDSILSINREQWTIIAIHQPLFSMGKKRDQRKTRDAFLSLFDKYHVALVLQGHDHVYARSSKLCNGTKVTANEKGTIYVTSVCGSDRYPLNPLYQGLMGKTASMESFYQVITIKGYQLTFSTFTKNGELFDTFTIYK